MLGMNKHILVGTLGRDPEVRFNANGTAFCNISLATARWNKQKQEAETDWHRVVLCGDSATKAGEKLKKGSKALFDGEVRTRKYKNEAGDDVFTTETWAFRFESLDPPKPKPEQQQQPQPKSFDDFDDDIPF